MSIRTYFPRTHKIANESATQNCQRLSIKIRWTDSRHSLYKHLPATDFIFKLFYFCLGQPKIIKNVKDFVLKVIKKYTYRSFWANSASKTSSRSVLASSESRNSSSASVKETTWSLFGRGCTDWSGSKWYCFINCQWVWRAWDVRAEWKTVALSWSNFSKLSNVGWLVYKKTKFKCRFKSIMSKILITEGMVANNCSSALVYSALAWTAATVCGWRFRKAAKANRETDLS